MYVLAALAGCAPSEQTAQSAADANAGSSAEVASEARFAPPVRTVGVVQLYAGDPGTLPVATLGSGETLTLAFDLLADRGRALSISFAHADRTWRRDLSTPQYMESFSNDTILEYTRSRGTQVPYVHYRYTFPNDDIRFRVSGNYIVRVAEQGRPDNVLFERPFFIDESGGSLSLGSESIIVTGQRQPSVRPVARFTPPDALRGNPFGYNVCFARNALWSQSRCAERPLLAERPALRFELDRQAAFAPRALSYTLDLRALRPGGDIDRIDRSGAPFRVVLEPDAAQFPDAGFRNGPLAGPAVDAFGRSEPDVTAEYVRTTFALVPPNEQPLRQPPILRGTFNGPSPKDQHALQWRAQRQRYEGDVLLKQGRYQYEYQLDAATRNALQRQTASFAADVYTTFVYYRDVSPATDRLLSVGTLRP